MSSYGNSRRPPHGSKGVVIAQDDAIERDVKFEGHSALARVSEKAEKKKRKTMNNANAEDLQKDMILNLQKQIATMETELKLLKEREVDQKNKASGYETLLADGIPLNEHFLALKNKYNNEEDSVKKTVESMKEENKREVKTNTQLRYKIEIIRTEKNNRQEDFNMKKQRNTKDVESQELQIYNHTHIKDILEKEKENLSRNVHDIKMVNAVDDREIKQARTFNKKDDIQKEKNKQLEALKEDVRKQRK